MTGTWAHTRDAALFVPDVLVKPNLFQILQPLRGSAWTLAVVDTITGRCVGYWVRP